MVPSGALVQATNGDLYGTTTEGGANCANNRQCGTVFKITLDGAFTTLHSFKGRPDGATPNGGLIQATDGNLYGTTSNGGDNGFGSIFKITPHGDLTILYSFCAQTANCPQGRSPAAGLMQDTNGNFYGTTQYSGAYHQGTVYEFSMGLGPFVKTLPAIGAVGSGVRILGTGLTGATSVTFNGIAAMFAVVSPSQIVARVPAGATTGKIQVTTPSGTLVSNVAFLVP
jgi:uncharacterized repeat protein (TIGR03803 family)